MWDCGLDLDDEQCCFTSCPGCGKTKLETMDDKPKPKAKRIRKSNWYYMGEEQKERHRAAVRAHYARKQNAACKLVKPRKIYQQPPPPAPLGRPKRKS